jgi:hypothetical protein
MQTGSNNFEYPTTTELLEINPEKVQLLREARPIFTIFPIVEKNVWRIEWRQKDNYRGMQGLRGLNGKPTRVTFRGERRFSFAPGVYGDYRSIDEETLTTAAQYGPNDGTPIDLTDEILEIQDQLNMRELDRIEYIVWQLLLNGTFIILGPFGVVHQDSYNFQQFSATISWVNYTTATPLADLRAITMLALGKSVNFGTQSRMWMNSVTASGLYLNRNAADLGGFKADFGRSMFGLEDVNKVLVAQGLPQIQLYDEGYFAEPSGTFTKWIPDNQAVLIGQRTTGESLGQYVMARNANNPNNAPGSYEKIIDKTDEVPREIQVHRGHNGGPCIFFPSAIVRMNL